MIDCKVRSDIHSHDDDIAEKAAKITFCFKTHLICWDISFLIGKTVCAALKKLLVFGLLKTMDCGLPFLRSVKWKKMIQYISKWRINVKIYKTW